MKIQLKKILTQDEFSHSIVGEYIYYNDLLIEVNGEDYCYLPSYANKKIQEVEIRNNKLKSLSTRILNKISLDISEYSDFLKENNIRFSDERLIRRGIKKHDLKDKIISLKRKREENIAEANKVYSLRENYVSIRTIYDYSHKKINIDKEMDDLLKTRNKIAITASTADVLLFNLKGAEMENGCWWSES